MKLSGSSTRTKIVLLFVLLLFVVVSYWIMKFILGRNQTNPQPLTSTEIVEITADDFASKYYNQLTYNQRVELTQFPYPEEIPPSEDDAPITTELNPNSLPINYVDTNAVSDSVEKTLPVMVYDLREPAEYVKGHIRDAYNLPWSVIEAGNYNLPNSTEFDLIFYSGDTPIDKTALESALNQKGIYLVQIVGSDYNELQSGFDIETGGSTSEIPVN